MALQRPFHTFVSVSISVWAIEGGREVFLLFQKNFYCSV